MGIVCAADIIRASQRTVVLTGAGISTPSGIPDFRSPDSGLWERFDPFEVASLSTFRYEPLKFYEWLRSLAVTILNAAPNPAHLSLARLQELGFLQTIITQNIDALHQKAGAQHVLQIHGSLETATCSRCFSQHQAQQYISEYLSDWKVPKCPVCGGILKPDIVLMGEQLPVRIWLKAQEECRNCDLMIVVGSSLEVLPVAGLPMFALEKGAHLILVNYSTTYLDERADVVLHEDVADILPRIVAQVEKG